MHENRAGLGVKRAVTVLTERSSILGISGILRTDLDNQRGHWWSLTSANQLQQDLNARL